MWNYNDFNEHIKEETKIKKMSSHITTYKYPITLTFDDTIFRVTTTLAQNYQLDLTHNNFYDLIGFDKEVVKQTKTGPRVPNLNQDTEQLNIHCNLVS